MAITGIMFYLMNLYTPLFADDYDYSFSFASKERITSLMQIPESQFAHYFVVNGRFTTHTIAQFFLFLGKNSLNVMNIVGFLLLGVLIFYHATGNMESLSAGSLIIIYSAVFLLTPAFGQSFLWVDGSATYLYGVIIALLYLIPYRKVLRTGETSPSKVVRCVKFVGMTALGFFAGNTFENMGAALIIVIFAYMLIFKLKRVKIRAWMWGIGNILGLAASVLAPGTKSRLETIGGPSLMGIARNIIFIATDFVEYLWLPVTCILFMMIIQWNVRSAQASLLKQCSTLISKCSCTFIYATGALAAAFSMILSPQFPERAWSAPVVLIIIALVSSISELDVSCNLKKRAAFFLSVLVCVSCSTWINAYFELKSTFFCHLERIAQIEAAVEHGEKTVTISAITSKSQYSVFSIDGDLEWDSTVWPNIAMARYYDIDEIVRQQGDLHN